MKNGFTLIELLAVIVILSLLTLLASVSVVNIVKDSKSDLSKVQKEAILSAAKAWGADNISSLPQVSTYDGGFACGYITVGDLKNYGLLDSNLIDPENNKSISSSTKIKISVTLNDYEKPVVNYELDVDVSECSHLN